MSENTSFPNSWYASSTVIPKPRDRLDGTVKTDVCIIGAGFTGLTAALRLSEAGVNVTVVEAQRVGWGASGRNGGQIGSGYNKSQRWLATKLGAGVADTLWSLTEEAKLRVLSNIEKHAPEARYTPGNIFGARKSAELEHAKHDADYLFERYGYDKMSFLDRNDMYDKVGTKYYCGGVADEGAGHIHPLKYAFGLANAAEAAGTKILENTRITSIEETGKHAVLKSANGEIVANHYFAAGNGYIQGLIPKYDAKVSPVVSFIVATPPLEQDTLNHPVLKGNACVWDESPMVNYFRRSGDGRLLWGGRAALNADKIDRMKDIHLHRMKVMFPQLPNSIKSEFVWGGHLGMTINGLPTLSRLGNTGFIAGGYFGHGVLLSEAFGHSVANAILGETRSFDLLSKLPVWAFPFGHGLQRQAVKVAIAWAGFRDQFTR